MVIILLAKAGNDATSRFRLTSLSNLASSGGSGVTIGDAGTYTIEGEAEITTTAVSDADNSNSNGFYFPRGSKSITNWNGTQDQIILGMQNLGDSPTDDSGVFHTIQNNSATYSLEMRNNNGGSGSLRFQLPGSAKFFIKPKTSATFVLKSDDNWYLHSTSSGQVDLSSDNTFTGKIFAPAIELSARVGLAGVNDDTGTNGAMSRSGTIITKLRPSVDRKIDLIQKNGGDDAYITVNDQLLHIISNTSSNGSKVTLTHGFPTSNSFITIFCPGEKDLVLQPYSYAIVALSASNRWYVVSHSSENFEYNSEVKTGETSSLELADAQMTLWEGTVATSLDSTDKTSHSESANNSNRHILVNNSAVDLTLKDGLGDSTVYGFDTPGSTDYIMSPNQTVELILINGRWKILG